MPENVKPIITEAEEKRDSWRGVECSTFTGSGTSVLKAPPFCPIGLPVPSWLGGFDHAKDVKDANEKVHTILDERGTDFTNARRETLETIHKFQKDAPYMSNEEFDTNVKKSNEQFKDVLGKGKLFDDGIKITTNIPEIPSVKVAEKFYNEDADTILRDAQRGRDSVKAEEQAHEQVQTILGGIQTGLGIAVGLYSAFNVGKGTQIQEDDLFTPQEFKEKVREAPADKPIMYRINMDRFNELPPQVKDKLTILDGSRVFQDVYVTLPAGEWNPNMQSILSEPGRLRTAPIVNTIIEGRRFTGVHEQNVLQGVSSHLFGNKPMLDPLGGPIGIDLQMSWQVLGGGVRLHELTDSILDNSVFMVGNAQFKPGMSGGNSKRRTQTKKQKLYRNAKGTRARNTRKQRAKKQVGGAFSLETLKQMNRTFRRMPYLVQLVLMVDTLEYLVELALQYLKAI
jgi:hypothetical protein